MRYKLMISIIILLIIEGFAFFFINQIFDLTLVDYQVASSLLLVINTIVFVSLLGKHSRNKTEYIILIFAYFIRIILLYWYMYGSDIFSLIILLIIEGFAFFFINQIFDLTLVDYQVASSLLLVINTIVFVSLLGKHSRNKTEYIILIFAYFIRIILLYWDMYGSDIFSLPN